MNTSFPALAGSAARCGRSCHARFGAPVARAQQPPATPSAVSSLTAGRSTVLTTDFDVTRIAVTNPAIADATVVRPREILIDGKAPGTISLIVWGGDQRVQYDVVVEQPISALEQQIHQLFPGERRQVAVNADAIVLSGRVSSTEVMLRVAEVARAAAPKANVINMLQVPGGGGRAAGDAAGAIRRGEPPRAHRARHVVLHRRHRLQELDRPRHDAAVSVGDYTNCRTTPGARRIRWSSATS